MFEVVIAFVDYNCDNDYGGNLDRVRKYTMYVCTYVQSE